MADEEEIISEMPEYSVKSEFSKARICEQAVMSVLSARANEMKPGYYNTKFTKEGEPLKIWIPDSRDKFFGSVNALMSLLSPEINRDKICQKTIEEFENALEEVKVKYLYEELILYTEERILKYKKTGKRYLPQIDARVVVEIINQKTKRVEGSEIIGAWNGYVNCYKNEIVEIYDYLFARLNDLIDRNNYFKTSAGF